MFTYVIHCHKTLQVRIYNGITAEELWYYFYLQTVINYKRLVSLNYNITNPVAK